MKTISVNLKSFDKKTAFKFPIYIYNNTKICNLGEIELHSDNISSGMIKIGFYASKSSKKSKFINTGKIIFKGETEICAGFLIQNRGLIELGPNTHITEGCTFLIRDYLKIGEKTVIGFNSFFHDSDDHPVVNLSNNTIIPMSKGISIGKQCWLGAKTIVKKGVVLPSDIIVASANTLLTKDYSQIEPFSILGGMPAKVIASGYKPLVATKLEKEIINYFRHFPEKQHESFSMEKLLS